MKSKVDKLNVDKLVPVPADLIKLNDAGKNNVVKKTEHDELFQIIYYTTKIYKAGKKITNHDHAKYITNQEFNKLTSENSAAILSQTNLASKNDYANFV